MFLSLLMPSSELSSLLILVIISILLSPPLCHIAFSPLCPSSSLFNLCFLSYKDTIPRWTLLFYFLLVHTYSSPNTLSFCTVLYCTVLYCTVLYYISSGEMHPRSKRRESWLNRVREICSLCLDMGFLPHTNVGPLSMGTCVRMFVCCECVCVLFLLTLYRWTLDVWH